MKKTKSDNHFEETVSGSGINDYVQSHCELCDWSGAKHYAHNDHQYTNLNLERIEHRKTCKSLLEESTGCSMDGLDKLSIRGDS